jgi:hypothetical protein
MRIVAEARPTIVSLPCPMCAHPDAWVTFRGHSIATLVCPECEHTWNEDVQGHPILRELADGAAEDFLARVPSQFPCCGPRDAPPHARPDARHDRNRVARGPLWTYEVKWDGYRAVALKDGNRVQLLSRNQQVWSAIIPYDRYSRVSS